MGLQYANEGRCLQGEARQEQKGHWGKAAECSKTYALYSCNYRFDLKVIFGLGGIPHGDRIAMGESVLRLSLVFCGAIGPTDRVLELYSSYYRHM